MPRGKRQPLAERFWLNVHAHFLPDGQPDYAPCWLWTGGQSKGAANTRRGIIRADGPSRKRLYAHRLALILHTGEDRPGYDACHDCDTPLCCNPAHLHWGTHQENMREYVRKYGKVATEKRPLPPKHLLEASENPDASY